MVRMSFFALICAFFVASAAAPAPDSAMASASEWGPGDERGAANRITPAKVLEAVRYEGAELAVCLQATRLEQVSEVALAGESMPHKSTYFYPKLATGMVLKPVLCD